MISGSENLWNLLIIRSRKHPLSLARWFLTPSCRLPPPSPSSRTLVGLCNCRFRCAGKEVWLLGGGFPFILYP